MQKNNDLHKSFVINTATFHKKSSFDFMATLKKRTCPACCVDFTCSKYVCVCGMISLIVWELDNQYVHFRLQSSQRVVVWCIKYYYLHLFKRSLTTKQIFKIRAVFLLLWLHWVRVFFLALCVSWHNLGPSSLTCVKLFPRCRHVLRQ